MKHFILVAALLTAFNVSAQQNCGDTDVMFKILQEKYSERVIFAGRVEGIPDIVVTIWFNPKEKTATIVKSSLKDKRSCAVESLEEARSVNNTQNIRTNPNTDRYTH